ncbi:MAG: hypothetical protein HC785_31720, partial [Calothrix sp. CSU_2_0]|nr:hypothetical protein [Calothrix sp. CSU_2_0]
AEGEVRRQKAEGRSQKSEGRRQEVQKLIFLSFVAIYNGWFISAKLY